MGLLASLASPLGPTTFLLLTVLMQNNALTQLFLSHLREGSMQVLSKGPKINILCSRRVRREVLAQAEEKD